MSTRVLISKRLVLVNSASTLATRLLSLSVLVWLQQYLVRRISDEEYSLLPVVYSVMLFAPLVTTVLTSGLGRYITEAYAKNDDRRVMQIVSSMFPVLCGVGVVFLAGGLTLAWHIGDVLNIAPEHLWDARIMLAMLVLSTSLTLPLAPFTVGFFVTQRFVLQNIINLGIEVFRLGILFSLLFGVSARVLWVVAATVCANLLGQLVLTFVSRRLLPNLRFSPSHFRVPVMKELVGFGGWNFVGSVASTIRSGADPLILNKLAAPIDVACFHLGSLVPRQLISMSGYLRQPLLPVMTTLHAVEDTSRLRNVYLRGGRLALLVTMLPVVAVVFVAQPLMVLYAGIDYELAGTVLILFLARFPLAFGNIVAPMIATARSRLRGWVTLELASQLINVGLTIVLVGAYHMGCVGSALASLVVALVFFPFQVNVGVRLAETTWRDWCLCVMAPGLFPALVAAAPGAVAVRYTVIDTWTEVGLVSSLIGVVYTLVAAIVVARRTEDRKMMIEMWKGLGQRVKGLQAAGRNSESSISTR